MSTRWTVAIVGESPEKGTPNNVRDRALEPGDCLVFSSRAAVALSELSNAVAMALDDVAPEREVVELHMVPGSASAAFSGSGVYVKVHSIVSRTPFLEWLEGLLKSSDKQEAEAAAEQLETYRLCREAMDADPEG